MEEFRYVIHLIENHSEVIKIGIAALAGGFALWQYWNNSLNQNKNYKYIRITNLSSIWRKFYDDKDFMKIFSAFEKVENDQGKGLRDISPEQKLRFLAFLAEVYYFSEVDSIDKAKAKMLFQWHFRYTYINAETKYAFWDNIVSGVNGGDKQAEIDAEINQPYWKKYLEFAKEI